MRRGEGDFFRRAGIFSRRRRRFFPGGEGFFPGGGFSSRSGIIFRGKRRFFGESDRLFWESGGIFLGSGGFFSGDGGFPAFREVCFSGRESRARPGRRIFRAPGGRKAPPRLIFKVFIRVSAGLTPGRKHLPSSVRGAILPRDGQRHSQYPKILIRPASVFFGRRAPGRRPAARGPKIFSAPGGIVFRPDRLFFLTRGPPGPDNRQPAGFDPGEYLRKSLRN